MITSIGKLRRGWKRRRCRLVRVVKCVAAFFFGFAPLAMAGVEDGKQRLTLEACLAEAVQHNPEILRSRNELESAAGVRITLRARGQPELTVGAIAGQQGQEQTEVLGPSPGFPDGQRNERPSRLFTLATGTLTQPLYDFGVPASWRRGNLEVVIARQNFAVTVSTVLHAVRLQFYAAVFQHDLQQVLQQVRGKLDANLANSRKQLGAGLASRLSVLQAQVQVYTIAPAVTAAGGAYREALIELLRLLGREQGPNHRPTRGHDPLENVELDGSFDLNAPEVTFDAASAVQLGLRRRPDLDAFRATIAATAEDTKIVRAGYYPHVRFFINGFLIPQNAVRSGRPALRPGDDSRTTEADIGVNFDWTVIDTGAVGGTVKEFQAARDTLIVRLREQEVNLPGELAAVRATLAAAAAKRRALGQATVAGESTLDAVQQGVLQGTASQYEFLQAQNDVLFNRSDLLTASFEEHNAQAEFDRLTGGYMRFVPEPPHSAPHAK